MKLKTLAGKTLATATAFSMATTLFAGVPAMPVLAANNMIIEAEYGDFTGSKYGPGDFSNNCSVREFTGGSTLTIDGITLDEAGSRKVTLYYATGMDRPITVIVNGKSQTVDCSSTGTWVSGAGSVSFNADFKEGTNSIKFSAEVDGPNLDYITIDMTPEEEQKTLHGMIEHLKSRKSMLTDGDIWKVDALRRAYNSLSSKSDVYVENSLTELNRAVNKNSTFTYEAELGSLSGSEKVSNKGSNGAMVAVGDNGSFSIKVWKDKAGAAQVEVFYAVAADHRYVSCDVNGGAEQRFEEKCAADCTDLNQDSNKNLSWEVPNAKPVSQKVDMVEGWNTINFYFPKNTAGLDLSTDQNKYCPNIDKIQVELTDAEAIKTIEGMASDGASSSDLTTAFNSLSAAAKETLKNSSNSTVKSMASSWKSEDSFGEAVEKNFTVTFDTDGGSAVTAQTVKEGEKATEPKTSKTGYVFAGWYTADDKEFSFDTAITADITLKAHWAADTTIEEQAFDVIKGQFAELKEENYPAEKWQTVASLITQIEGVIDGTDPYAPVAKADKIKELVPQLQQAYDDLVGSELKDMKVTFKADNGTEDATVIVKEGYAVARPAEDPVKEGYNFLGWYLGDVAYNFEMSVTGDITLTAKWEENAVTKLANEIKDIIATIPSEDKKDDYTEDSWNAVQDKIDEINKELANGDAADVEKLETLKGELVDLIDKLAKKEFKVTFNSNGGSAVEAQSIVKGEVAKEPKNPTRDGYVFDKWLLDDVEYDFATPVVGAIELVADWNKNATFTETEKLFETIKEYINSLNQNNYTAEGWKQVQDIVDQINAELAKGEDADFGKIQSLVEKLNTLVYTELPKFEIKVPVDNSVKVTGIDVSYDPSLKIAPGKSVQLNATVTPATATNKAVKWTSSNPAVATVDANGKVTTTKAGKGKSVVITATAADGSGVVASVTVKVMKKAVKKVKISGATSVTAGKKVKLKATVTPKAKASQINSKLVWTSNKPKWATVTNKGVVKTKKAGKGKTVKITAKSTDGTNKKATFKIAIK